MARLMGLLAERVGRGGPVYDIVNGWEGDLTPSGASLPLRVAGGLHRLVLEGNDAELAAVYPPNAASEQSLVAAVEAAFARHEDFFAVWLDSPPQTNEVRRAAVVIAAAHLVASRHSLPFRLSELGASAGLNLGFDHFSLETNSCRLGPSNAPLILTPDWQGPVPHLHAVAVSERRGVDLRPLDMGKSADKLRLQAYLWPDQPERRTLTDAAIGISWKLGRIVDEADAADWLEARLARPVSGRVHFVYHTIAWQYFPDLTARRCRRALENAGRNATAEAPLAWVGMEADDKPDGAGLTLRLWPGDETYSLGRVDYHGRWVRWNVMTADLS